MNVACVLLTSLRWLNQKILISICHHHWWSWLWNGTEGGSMTSKFYTPHFSTMLHCFWSFRTTFLFIPLWFQWTQWPCSAPWIIPSGRPSPHMCKCMPLPPPPPPKLYCSIHHWLFWLFCNFPFSFLSFTESSSSHSLSRLHRSWILTQVWFWQ